MDVKKFYSTLIACATTDTARNLYAKFISRDTDAESRMKQLKKLLYRCYKDNANFDPSVSTAIWNEINPNFDEK